MASCCALGIYYSRVLYKESTLDSQLLFWNYNEQLFAILISLPFRIQIKWKKKSFRTPSWCFFSLNRCSCPPLSRLALGLGGVAASRAGHGFTAHQHCLHSAQCRQQGHSSSSVCTHLPRDVTPLVLRPSATTATPERAEITRHWYESRRPLLFYQYLTGT